MKRIKEITLVILIGLILTPSTLVWGQMTNSDQAYKNKLESILSSFKNYRYSNVSIYELDRTSIGDLRKYDKALQGAALGGEAGGAFDEASIKQKFRDNQDLKDAGGHYGEQQYDFIKDQARSQEPKNAILQAMSNNKGWAFANMADIDAVYNYWKNADAGQKKLEAVYVLTQRANNENIDPTLGVPVPEYIVSAMFVYTKEDAVSSLDGLSIRDIYTEPELHDVLEPSYAKILKDTTVYDHIYKFFQQGNAKDVTLEAQGIGTTIKYVAQRAGQSSNIETGVGYLDKQAMMRISEGQPLEMKMKKNEVIVAPDVLSWKRYDYTKYDEEAALAIKEREEGLALAKQDYATAKEKLAADPNNRTLKRAFDIASDELEYQMSNASTNTTVNNLAPPVIGFEMKYGIEEIGYPSLWSERMTTRAVWNGVKLGAILPTNGWSGVFTEDMFDIERKLTHTEGAGVSAAFDFAIPVIPESGVFQLNASYVAGDAKAAKYNDNHRDMFKNGVDNSGNPVNFDVNDYVIRYTAQLFYTFAMAIDEEYKLRFGLGATIYGAEEWNNIKDYSTNELTYAKRADETVGNVAMKMDFMATGSSTPWGATVQYFDSGIYGDIWMQVPVVDNTFSIRLDAKGFFKAFDDPHPWENESVFMPSVRFIMFF
jgi:hypothetical protein